MNAQGHTNAPTAEFVRSMREVAFTLNASSASLLGVAGRLAEAGCTDDALRLIDLVKAIEQAEDKVRKHATDAGFGIIVKLSKH